MEFNEFKEELFAVLNDKLDNHMMISERTVMKNNGKVLTGVTIQNDGDLLFPTFYYEDLYEGFCDNNSLEEIADHILKTYYTSRKFEMPDLEFIADYSQMSTRVLPKLIQTKKNVDFLKTVPHVSFLDLSVVFYCLVLDDNLGNGSITITNDTFLQWNIGMEELFEDAKRNLKRLLNPSIKPIHEILLDPLKAHGKDVDELMDALEDGNQIPMFVMTNAMNTYGAASLLDTECIRSFSEKIDSDIFILPSSVHEVILVRAFAEYDVKELEAMVISVNETEVPDDEILSDHIYFYSRKNGSIEIAS